MKNISDGYRLEVLNASLFVLKVQLTIQDEPLLANFLTPQQLANKNNPIDFSEHTSQLMKYCPPSSVWVSIACVSRKQLK